MGVPDRAASPSPETSPALHRPRLQDPDFTELSEAVCVLLTALLSTFKHVAASWPACRGCFNVASVSRRERSQRFPEKPGGPPVGHQTLTDASEAAP